MLDELLVKPTQSEIAGKAEAYVIDWHLPNWESAAKQKCLSLLT